MEKVHFNSVYPTTLHSIALRYTLVDAKTMFMKNMEIYVGSKPKFSYKETNKNIDIVTQLTKWVEGMIRIFQPIFDAVVFYKLRFY